jgi:hypothetical protein
VLTSTTARIRVPAAIAALVSLPLLGAVALAATGGLGAASSAFTHLEPRLLANPSIWIDESVQSISAVIVVDDY